ncbi:MAG TPA: DUF5615 family PIN-like protein [Gemmataceae bacterium]
MSVPLYMDHHVHAAITSGLRQRGVDVLTAYEDGAGRLGDEQLLERATQRGGTLFTQDDDLLVIAHRWLQAGREFAGLVFGQPVVLSVGKAIQDLELIAKALEPEDLGNRIEYIPYP